VSGEYEFQLRGEERRRIILPPVVFFVSFLSWNMVLPPLTEAMVLIFPTFYAMTAAGILPWLLGYNFSVAVWVGYNRLFGSRGDGSSSWSCICNESLDRAHCVRSLSLLMPTFTRPP